MLLAFKCTLRRLRKLRNWRAQSTRASGSRAAERRVNSGATEPDGVLPGVLTRGETENAVVEAVPAATNSPLRGQLRSLASDIPSCYQIILEELN